MVKERRYVFDVGDIEQIIYACPCCKHEMVYRVQSSHAPQGETCASCGWGILKKPDIETTNPNVTFLVNLRAALMTDSVRVRLVVPDPDEDKSDAREEEAETPEERCRATRP